MAWPSASPKPNTASSNRKTYRANMGGCVARKARKSDQGDGTEAGGLEASGVEGPRAGDRFRDAAGWTTAGPGPRLGLILHHTDAEREWAFDRHSAVGRLSRALDEAPGRGWVVVDMKAEWRKVFGFDE